jgi:3-hydroxy-D-aspartate aldolase
MKSSLEGNWWDRRPGWPEADSTAALDSIARCRPTRCAMESTNLSPLVLRAGVALAHYAVTIARSMNRPSPARIGEPLQSVDTPALVLDLDAFERNLSLMAETVRAARVALRPHAKSHKCPAIALRQIAAGAVGVCCQKVSEAEALVDGGVADVLVTNQIVGAGKLARLAQLAQRARIAVLADDAANVAALAAAAAEAAVTLDVLVEVDVGTGRCGVRPGEPALALARAVAACRSLRFAGLHAYHGAAQHLRTAAQRSAAIATAADMARASRDLIAGSGIACPTVTGAGTGTYPLEAASGVWNELQPGSYLFMDADYGRNECDPRWPRFAQSLFVLTTVMSRPAADRAIVDAGLKASSTDSGMPLVWARDGLEFVKASDEHGVLRVAPGVKAPALGEKLLLVPGHCDPTVNLYDQFVCMRGGRVDRLWDITARGAIW